MTFLSLLLMHLPIKKSQLSFSPRLKGFEGQTDSHNFIFLTSPTLAGNELMQFATARAAAN